MQATVAMTVQFNRARCRSTENHMVATREPLMVIQGMLPDNHRDSAYRQYKSIVIALAANRRLLEIGAGRRPLLTPEEIKERNVHYTANDIMQNELDLIPFPVEKAVFDSCGGVPPECAGRYDVICSKMVQEHVSNGEKFYSNILKLLSNGGVALNFHPTLYSPPFFINRAFSEHLTRAVLRFFKPERNVSNIPKFPATYELCYSLAATANVISKIGFSAVQIIPFYHHEYFASIPGLRTLDNALSDWARRQDVRALSSYAYTVVIK
jgi:2-polyprenyl-3-methyl-5-hydroxy-6-metoxy-1,4-benzoquinol methylase